jgi:hypothetical protein
LIAPKKESKDGFAYGPETQQEVVRLQAWKLKASMEGGAHGTRAIEYTLGEGRALGAAIEEEKFKILSITQNTAYRIGPETGMMIGIITSCLPSL